MTKNLRIERGDWKNSAYTIYEEITNEKIDTPLTTSWHIRRH